MFANVFDYSESQIYEYIARVFYTVVFSTYLGSNAAEKNEFNVLIAFLHISGLLIYLELNMKKNSFLKNYQKSYLDIFS